MPLAPGSKAGHQATRRGLGWIRVLPAPGAPLWQFLGAILGSGAGFWAWHQAPLRPVLPLPKVRAPASAWPPRGVRGPGTEAPYPLPEGGLGGLGRHCGAALLSPPACPSDPSPEAELYSPLTRGWAVWVSRAVCGVPTPMEKAPLPWLAVGARTGHGWVQGSEGLGGNPVPVFSGPIPPSQVTPPPPLLRSPRPQPPPCLLLPGPFGPSGQGICGGLPGCPPHAPPIMCAALGRGLDGSPPTARWPWVATRLGGWAEAGGRAFQAQGRQRGPLAPPHPQSSHCQVSKGHCY